MNREILFRGKRADNGEWIYGCIANGFTQKPEYIMPKMYFATRDFGEIDKSGKPIIEEDMALGGFIPIIPDTIGQFTGLTDKNGIKIFEGDKVVYTLNHDSSQKEIEAKIEWHNHAWRLNRIWLLTEIRTIEVLGNIHDNPELLK